MAAPGLRLAGEELDAVTLPAGTCTTTVGGASVTVTPGRVTVQAGENPVGWQGHGGRYAHVTGNITSSGSIMDTTGNSNHHTLNITQR
ncbi:hypothetical protein ACPA9J_11285 [Pseudomonas aeruginosa]